MKKFRKNKSWPLYDVIGKSKVKGVKSSNTQPLRQDNSQQQVRKNQPFELGTVKWRKKPKTVMINDGRLELSLTYPAAITILLIITLAVIISYRVGQGSGKLVETGVSDAQTAKIEPIISNQEIKSTQTKKDSTMSAVSKVDHVVMLAQYHTKADFVPVQEHFAKFGIATEIKFEGKNYFLVTKNRYQNPEKKDTDGFAIKEKIKEVGRAYKAPQGYETFAPHYFGDCYGMKVK